MMTVPAPKMYPHAPADPKAPKTLPRQISMTTVTSRIDDFTKNMGVI